MLHLVVLGGGALGATLLHIGRQLWKKHAQEKAQQKARAIMPKTKTSQPLTVIDANEISKEKQDAKHNLQISVASLSLAAVGEFFYPPLLLPAVSLILYNCVPIFQSAYHSIQQKKLKSSVIDSIAVIGALGTQYYVASALASVVYYTAQKLLLETEDQSKKQLTNIFGTQPRSVWLIKDGVEVELAFERLQAGDVIVLQAGELIPIDGTILKGNASINQQIMTGEAQPVEVKIADTVLAGTLLVSGTIWVQVDKCGQDTVAAKIGQILQNTADFRLSVEARGQQLSDSLVPSTLAIGGAGLVLLGPVSGIAALSCNFSEVLRVVAPIGVLNFLKIATEQGILIKDGRSLELLNDVDTVVFDKTGTLTLEQPHVSKVHTWSEYSADEVLCFAAAAEYKQTHPIAKAILHAAKEREIILPAIDNAKYNVGYGIKVELEQQIIHVGSLRFMGMQNVQLPEAAQQLQTLSHDHGYSVIFISVDQHLIGAIELHATIRPEAKAVIQALKQRGLALYIISGDHEKPTRHLAESLGIKHYFAETLPEHKAQHIERLQQQGKSVCFIGDGINDTIALKTAKVSISLKGASTAATDTAGIILMEKNLNQLPMLFELAKDLNQNVKNSYHAALVPGIIGVSGIFLFHFGIYSSLMLYMASLGVGTTNAMLPLLKYQDKSKITPKLNHIIATRKKSRVK